MEKMKRIINDLLKSWSFALTGDWFSIKQGRFSNQLQKIETSLNVFNQTSVFLMRDRTQFKQRPL